MYKRQVAGTSYVIGGFLPNEAISLGFAVGALSTGILVANNLRDRISDKRAGRKTLAIRFGQLFSRWEYVICMLLPIFLVLYAIIAQSLETKYALSLSYLLWAYSPIISVLKGADGRDLNKVLEKSGKATLSFGLLFALTSFL